MEERIIISADTKEALNKRIDENIKRGYLIKDQMFVGEQEMLSQVMCLPKNIDSEVTMAAVIQLVFLVLFMGGISYLII